MCTTTDNFSTPEKKRSPSSPPVAHLRKRQKENQDPEEPEAVEDALLLISAAEDGDVVAYSSNHPVLAGVSGHWSDISLFYTDELFESVLDVVGGNGYSATNRELCFAEEIRKLMKESLIKLFSQEIYGGGYAADGQVFRGTIIVL